MLLACLLQLFSTALGDTSQCSSITVNGDDLDTISVWTDGVTSRLGIAKPTQSATASPLTAKTASMMKCGGECSFPLLTFVTSVGAQSSFLHIQEPLSFLVPSYFSRFPSNESIRCVPYPGYCGALVPLYRHYRVTSFGVQHAYTFSADVSYQDFNVEGNPVCYFWQSDIVAADPQAVLPDIPPTELTSLRYFDNQLAGTMKDHYATTFTSIPGYTELSPLGKVATNTSTSCDEMIALVQMVDNQSGAFARLDHKLVPDNQEPNRLFEQYTALPEKIYCTARPVCGATVPLWKLFDYVNLDSMYATSPTTSPNTYLYPNAPLCYIWDVNYGEDPEGITSSTSLPLGTTESVPNATETVNSTTSVPVVETTISIIEVTTMASENATVAHNPGETTAPSEAHSSIPFANSTIEVTTVSSVNATEGIHSNSTVIPIIPVELLPNNLTSPEATALPAVTSTSPVENSTNLATVFSANVTEIMNPFTSSPNSTIPSLEVTTHHPEETTTENGTVFVTTVSSNTTLPATTVMPINIVEEGTTSFSNATSIPSVESTVGMITGTTVMMEMTTLGHDAPLNGTTVAFTSSNATWEQLFPTTISSITFESTSLSPKPGLFETAAPSENITVATTTNGHILTGLPDVTTPVSSSGSSVSSGESTSPITTSIGPAFTMQFPGMITTPSVTESTMGATGTTVFLTTENAVSSESTGMPRSTLPSSFIDIIENVKSSTPLTGLTTSVGLSAETVQTTSVTHEGTTLPAAESTHFLGTTLSGGTETTPSGQATTIAHAVGETTIHPTEGTTSEHMGSTVFGTEGTTASLAGSTTIIESSTASSHIEITTVPSHDPGSTVITVVTTMGHLVETSSLAGMEITHDMMGTTLISGSTVEGTTVLSHDPTASTIAIKETTMGHVNEPSSASTGMEITGHEIMITTPSGITEGTTLHLESSTISENLGANTAPSHDTSSTAAIANAIETTHVMGTTEPLVASLPTVSNGLETTSHAGSTVFVEGTTATSIGSTVEAILTTGMTHDPTATAMSSGMTSETHRIETTAITGNNEAVGTTTVASHVESTITAIGTNHDMIFETAGTHPMETTSIITQASIGALETSTAMETPAHDPGITSLPEMISTLNLGGSTLSSSEQTTTMAQPVHNMSGTVKNEMETTSAVSSTMTTMIFTANTLLWEKLFPTTQPSTVESTVAVATTVSIGESTESHDQAGSTEIVISTSGQEETSGTTAIQSEVTTAGETTIRTETTVSLLSTETVTHAPLASATPGNFFEKNVTMPTVPSWAG